MTSVVDAVFWSWPAEPGLAVALALSAGVYLRGWLLLRRRDARHWHGRQPAAFLGGLLALFLALASPIEPFAAFFLQVHMAQHLLLMMAVPPLLWLGDPLIPFLKGLPTPIRDYWIGPLFRWMALRSAFRVLCHPFAAGLIYVTAAWLWHVPALYELALASDSWHYAQHLTFLVAGLLFWFPVVRPYPFRPSWSPWLLIPLLIVADVQNTLLSALLTFSDHVVYPHYEAVPRLNGSSALDDQAAAGAMMWLFGSLAYLVPLFAIAVRSLLGAEAGKKERTAGGRIALPVVSVSRVTVGQVSNLTANRLGPESQGLEALLHKSGPPIEPNSTPRFGQVGNLTYGSRSHTRVDLLRAPVLGPFLRWRHARLCLQVPLAVLAAVMIYDGLTGPAEAPMNLAGVLPWVHWRGALVLGLLVVGNVFCTACPFMLPRRLARRLLPQPFVWPRRLRNKWLALLLIGIFLWAYEALSLWDSPWCSAWIAVGYFIGALAIDGLFQGAAFCKYVCPIGQFNFVQSLLSPWEIKARDPAVCATCRTHDCIRGNPSARGCELGLFIPRKAGNMDCTLCLDCVHACPHDNVGLIAGPPGAGLWDDRSRAGLGRFGRRGDLAALVLLLTFGAFANAAGMAGPVVEWQQQLGEPCGPMFATTAYFLVTLVVLPLMTVSAAAALSQRWGGLKAGVREVATRYAYTLAPLGFGMWLAHYGFHLATSYDAVVPVMQRFAADLGLAGLGAPVWGCSCCRDIPPWLLPLEMLFLDFGLLVSLYAAYRLALSLSPRPAAALKALTPWAVLMTLLFAAGIWVLFQPMPMRGAQ